MKDGEPFAFAGLREAWKDPGDGSWLQSYSIITTTPNELTAQVHNRMPVILEPRDYNRWLERVDNERPPIDLLRPFAADEMKAQEASKDVGNVRNNTYFYMGKAELQLNHTDRAVPLLRHASEMNPDDSGALYLLARALRSEGNAQDADTVMHRVVELHTTAIDAERRALKDAHIVAEH